MNNAERLFEVLRTNHENKTLPYRVSDINAIIDAYNMLPTLYLYKIKEAIEEIYSYNPNDEKSLKCVIGETLSGYLDFWDERVYRARQTWQWLSITVDHEKVTIYFIAVR